MVVQTRVSVDMSSTLVAIGSILVVISSILVAESSTLGIFVSMVQNISSRMSIDSKPTKIISHLEAGLARWWFRRIRCSGIDKIRNLERCG